VYTRKDPKSIIIDFLIHSAFIKNWCEERPDKGALAPAIGEENQFTRLMSFPKMNRELPRAFLIEDLQHYTDHDQYPKGFLNHPGTFAMLRKGD